MQLTIHTKNIIKFLVIVSLLLILIHTIILVIYYLVGDSNTFGFIRMFDLDMERNVPTLFSSLLFAISAFLFYLLSKTSLGTKNRDSKYWKGLSFIFIFLSVDESAKIHEQLGDFTKQFVDATGYLHYPWVILYSLLVMFLAVIYLKFFLKMPKKTFYSFMFSASIFLAGAIGFELLGANESSLHGTTSILYSVFYTIEESLEMFGLIYLIYILLSLLEEHSFTLKQDTY